MSASHRLSRLDFNRLKVARRLPGVFFTLALGEVPGRSLSGFACVVSKKVARKAVDRNRIKRRIRAIFQDVVPRFSNQTVLVAYVKAGAAKATMQDLRNDMDILIRRLHPLPPGGQK